MSNTINVSGMTGYYNGFVQSVNTKNKIAKTATTNVQVVDVTSNSDFILATEDKAEISNATELQKIKNPQAVSARDMTLEEYKQYIRDKISGIQMCQDRLGDYISINISDSGFKAMQNDPEYEKWVLQDIENGFSTPLPGWVRSIGGADYVVANYGATRDECSCTSWSMGYQGGTGDKIWEAKSKGSFWSKRGDKKRIQEEFDKKVADKKENEKKLMKVAMEKRQSYSDFLNGKAILKSKSFSDLDNHFFIPTGQRVTQIISAYEAGTIKTGE